MKYEKEIKSLTERLDTLTKFIEDKLGFEEKLQPKFKVGDIVETLTSHFIYVITDIDGYDNGEYWYRGTSEQGYNARLCEKFLSIYEKPKFEFTEDEKVILRNLPEEYEWITRDEDGELFLYNSKPSKRRNYWDWDCKCVELKLYKHLFQSIQWSNDEPCEFRKYL